MSTFGRFLVFELVAVALSGGAGGSQRGPLWLRGRFDGSQSVRLDGDAPPHSARIELRDVLEQHARMMKLGVWYDTVEEMRFNLGLPPNRAQGQKGFLVYETDGRLPEAPVVSSNPTSIL